MAETIFWTLYFIIVFLMLNWTVWELHKLRKSKKQDSVKELYNSLTEYNRTQRLQNNLRATLQDELLLSIYKLSKRHPDKVGTNVYMEITERVLKDIITNGINSNKS